MLASVADLDHSDFSVIFPSHGALLGVCILDEGVDVIALRDHMTGPYWAYMDRHDGLL